MTHVFEKLGHWAQQYVSYRPTASFRDVLRDIRDGNTFSADLDRAIELLAKYTSAAAAAVAANASAAAAADTAADDDNTHVGGLTQMVKAALSPDPGPLGQFFKVGGSASGHYKWGHHARSMERGCF